MRKPNERRSSISIPLSIQVLGFGLALVIGMNQAQAQTFTVLHTFTGFPTDGRFPYGPLIQDKAGNLYGTTLMGGAFAGGTIFKLDTNGHETVLFNFFHDTRRDFGIYPYAGLLLDGAGNLYGTTSAGGDLTCTNENTFLHAAGCGTIFKLEPTGKMIALHRFQGSDGAVPLAGLTAGAPGIFYGTTSAGGDLTCGPPGGCGAVFKLEVAATSTELTVLHRFHGPNGSIPFAGVIRDTIGNLYGITSVGGFYNAGLLFEVDTLGHEIYLHSFNGNAFPAWVYPTEGLVRDTAGNLYGAAPWVTYGAFCCGGVFKLDSSGQLTVLSEDVGQVSPYGSLILDSAGKLYGTSNTGHGLVFELDPNGPAASGGNVTPLYRFSGGADGDSPQTGLLRDAAGNLYGTAAGGGMFSAACPASGLAPGGCGVVFKITP